MVSPPPPRLMVNVIAQDGAANARAKVMIDSYLAGRLPTLTAIPLEETTPGMLDKLRGLPSKSPFAEDDKKLKMMQTFAGNQDSWTRCGYYFATGSHIPIVRIMQTLPWSKSATIVDKLTVGSMGATRWRAMRSAMPDCPSFSAASLRGSRRQRSVS